MASDLSMGEIARTLHRLEGGQERLLERIDLMRGEFVHRTEFEARNKVVDEAFVKTETRIGLVETRVYAKGLPWPMIATAITSIIALALVVLETAR